MNDKRYVLITGASSGIGYSTAVAFAKRGKNLILAARNKERLEKLKNEILNENSELDVVIKVTDLSIMDNVYKLYEDVKPYFIETLINNAGFGNYDPVAKQDVKKIEKLLNLDIEALTILSTLYVHDYYNVEGTQLINISSCGGYIIVPNAVTYCAAKFFVSTFTEGLARELIESHSKLRAKVLAPAATKTNFGNVANDIKNYNYDRAFGKYHTSKQMADFLMQLYDSNKVIGAVDRETFQFDLKEPVFEYAGKSAHNQKK